MLDYYLDRWLSRGQALFYGVTLIGGTLLLVFSGWLWWHYQYLNPQNVFWSAVSNNLAITAVTKQTVSEGNGQKLNQSEQIRLGAQNSVKGVSSITQEDPKSVVVTETIGTPNANFARYTKIETDQKTPAGQTPDFSPVISRWSKAELDTNNSGGFATAIFDAVPFANLNGTQRKQVMHEVKHEEVYKVDFNKVSKERKNGRLYYTYDVSIAGDKYITLLKQVDSMMGLNQLKELDPTQYQGGEPIKMRFTIDAVGHQFASLTYLENNRTTSYSSWGAQTNTDIPEGTISQNDLQTKLNNILTGN